jgi:hypothetical protein
MPDNKPIKVKSKNPGKKKLLKGDLSSQIISNSRSEPSGFSISINPPITALTERKKCKKYKR